MTKLVEVEGIGEKYVEKLKAAGVTSAEVLLEKAGTPKGRKELAEKSGISDASLLEWANHIDLFRIKGIGSEYADLIEEAGVDTVPELARRNAEALCKKMTEANEAKKLVRKLPTKAQVEDWITQAKQLPRTITY